MRNGTRGLVLAVAEDEQSATVRLTDGRQASWERGQLDAASARLAYVSHTFPAQGQTVDRAHVIAGQHADANGSYVALTRVRERTHLYASVERLEQPGDEGGGGREAQLARLAERLGRSEPEAAAVMASEPRDQRAELAHANAQRAGEQARLAAARGERLEGERVKLGRLARLGERGRALKTQLAVERARERDALADQHRFSREADAREVKLGEQRREWEVRHPGARERHDAAEREHQLAEQARQAAEQRHDIAQARAVLAVTRPPPGAHQRRQELWQEQARLHALGQDADPARLAEVRAELAQLTRSGPEPSRAQLGRRLGLGPAGPTIGR